MVTGDHHRADARLAALVDGVLHLRAHRVDHTRQTYEAQILLQGLGAYILGQLIAPAALGGGQDPEGPVGHGLILQQNGPTLFLGHGAHFAVLYIAGAKAQHLIRGALGILDKAAVDLVDGGHHLSGGVKGGLGHPGLLLLQQGLFQPRLGGKIHQSRLRRLALGPLLGPGSVAAQGHGRGQEPLGACVVHHGHLILGKGAGLIGANDLGAAQGLHRRQPADHRPALTHVGNADGQHHRHHRSQALGNGGHSQGNGHHEGFQNGLQGVVALHQQVKHKDKHADGQHQIGKGLAQLGQLALEGGLLLLRPGQNPGDLAHFGVHAGGGDDGATPAIDHGGAHVAHIFPVAQGHIPLGADGLGGLIHRDALAGEGGFLDFQGGGLQQPTIGGHGVSGLQQHHISGHQVGAVQHGDLAVPQHLAGGGGHGLQGLNGGLGLALLHHAQNGVQQHHRQDDDNLRQLLPGEDAGNGGHCGGGHQNQQHRVLQLLQKTLEVGDLLGLLQAVGAVLLQARGSLL